MSLLEVGLEEERDVALLSVALSHLAFKRGEELRSELRLPQATYLLDHRKRNLWITPDHTGIKESEGDAQVLLGDAQDVLRLPDGVVDLDALVPQRVPQGLGDLLDIASTLMDEQKIKIRVRAQLTAAVAPDSDEGELPR